MKKLLYLLLFLFLIQSYICAQEKGNLFIRNYLPKEYSAHVQNWSITQTNTGIILIGNGDGILYRDGLHFKIFSLPNKTTIRSFAKGTDGTIYIGSVGHFGYLTITKNGALNYINLAAKLDSLCPKFFDIWAIVATPENIYFRATNIIFRYNIKSKKIARIDAITSHSSHFLLGSKIYVKESRDGIYELKNDSLQAISNKTLKKIPFLHYCQISPDSILVPSGNRLFYIYLRDGKIYSKRLKTTNPKLIATAGVYTLASKGNNIYLGTGLNGVIVIDKGGKIKKIIDAKKGLLKGAIYGESFDKDGNLWLAMSNGFAFINLNSPVSFWDSRNGIDATVEDIIRFKGDIYIASHQDFYHLDKQNNISTVGNLKTQTWNFSIYKIPNKNDSILLAASSFGLHQITRNNKLKDLLLGNTIFSIYPWKKRKDIVFLGLGNGLEAIRYSKGKWIFEKRFAAVEDNIRAIEEDNNGNLWLGTFRNGAIKLVFQDTSLNIISAKYYNTQNGFKSTKNVLVYPSSSGLVFTCEKGIYHYSTLKDSMISAKEYGEPAIDTRDIFDFQELNDKTIYISGLYNKNTPVAIGKPNGNTYTWDFNSCKAIPNMMVLGIFCEQDAKAWFGGSEGLFLYNPQQKKNYKQSYAYVSSVFLNDDSLYFSGFFAKKTAATQFSFFQHSKSVQDIAYQDNSISFNFASSIYYFEDKQQFSYKLEGYDKKWSKWTKHRQKQYTNLYEGEYTFKLKAKDIYNNVSKTYNYSFIIKAPFYRTIWAYLVYAITIVFLIWLIVYLYSRRLIKQKKALERTVQERTLEIRKQNEEIILQNAELIQAKEEIMAQAELLELTNKELEKLSIVASETSNAVAIFDKNLELEWVNAAFVRIYGYTYADFIEEYGSNLIKVSANKKIQEAINECITLGKPVQYESFNKTKNGRQLWMQVTLSPILNEKNEIKKLIAIESEISRLKMAEEEIKLQNEEIKTQNERLNEVKIEIEAQRDDLIWKNKQIEGSINYGLTIQQALLPTPKMLNSYFNNFILYRPRDIVSGDFYWYSAIKIQPKIEYDFLAVVDCTGHGVPGAFMSMIGNRLLGEIINERQIYMPSSILTEMDKAIKKALKQDTSENNDGMDMSIIRLERKEGVVNKLIYSGAKRPILLYHHQKDEIELITATRKSIGGAIFKNPSKFIDKSFEILTGDRVYQYTDGYIDQNGTERKRFGTKRFLALMNEIKQLSLQEQKEHLELSLDNYKKGEMQRDDITIVAIEINNPN